MKASHLIIFLCLLMTACVPLSTPTPTDANLPAPERTVRATDTTSLEPTLKPGWLAFQGKDLGLMYPDTWSSEVLADHPRFLYIESNSDDVKMNITRSPLSTFRGAKTLEDVDKGMWSASLTLYELAGHKDRVKLESHETIVVGGQSAAKRVFAAPVIQDPSQTVHKMLIWVVRGENVFQIVVNAASESALHGAEIAEIISSIHFNH